MFYTINYLRLYALFLLIIFDWHYFFNLCYEKGRGLSMVFVSFYFNSPCIYWATFAICATFILLFILSELLRIFFIFVLRKKRLGLAANILIVASVAWLLHLIKLFSLTT